MSGTDPAKALRIGRNVFVGLAVATAVEFVIAISTVPGALVLILIVALIKAWLIVVYFMHVGQLRGGS
ncbi:MAG: cytochrome C oxidase subunit IV family protein [Acidimicrobiia bacterium]